MLKLQAAAKVTSDININNTSMEACVELRLWGLFLSHLQMSCL